MRNNSARRQHYPSTYGDQDKFALNIVRRAIKRSGGRLGDIFYNSHAHTFNKAFFSKNYLKATAAFEVASATGFLRNVTGYNDLGGGAGPASLAAWSLFKAENINLIEKSRCQCSLAERVSAAHGATFKVRRFDISLFRPAPGTATIMLYVACEINDIEAMASNGVLGDKSIIIDYKEKLPIIESAISGLYKSKIFMKKVNVSSGRLVGEKVIFSNFILAERKNEFG